jgi:cell division protein ZapD
MLDLLSVIGRADLKTELARELGEQDIALKRLRARADVDHDKLDGVLRDIRNSLAGLQRMAAHPSIMLRENEFLFAILNRSAIPGGTCEFDLPAYHRWLSRPHAGAESDLSAWFSHLAPLESAIGLVLRLLRDSAASEDCIARGGVHLHVPPANCQLVRVQIAGDADVYPEISAGRHRFSFRFMTLEDVNRRNVQTQRDIAFRLQCCSLATP